MNIQVSASKLRESDPRCMSDWQRKVEYAELARYQAALSALRSALQDVQSGSVLVSVDLEAFELFVHDELPSVEDWEVRLSEAI